METTAQMDDVHHLVHAAVGDDVRAVRVIDHQLAAVDGAVQQRRRDVMQAAVFIGIADARGGNLRVARLDLLQQEISSEGDAHISRTANEMAWMAESRRRRQETVNLRGKYNYLSEREMTNTLRPVMQELGLVDVCIGTEMHTEAFVLPKKDGSTDENKSVLLTEVIKTYRVYDINTGDYVDFKAVGSGSDTMDKGCNKAVTGARKNFLKDLGNFPSPEREDPDTTPSSSYSANKSSGSAGDVVLKYGVHAGKSLQDLFDENPEEVEKIAAAKDKSGNPTWIAQKAQAFLNTLAAA